MPVPNTFAGATTSIPLSQLDNNFATAITLGNTAIQLGNTVTTLNNMTLANVTITSGNITATTASVTGDIEFLGNVVVTANSSTTAVLIKQIGSGNALVVEDETNPDASPFVVTATGNVGIGTTAPGVKLDVFSSINGNDGIFYTNQSTGSSAQAIMNVATSGAYGLAIGQQYTTKIGSLYLGDNADLVISTNATEKMRITAAGKVGIGTPDPVAQAAVYGSGQATYLTFSTSGNLGGTLYARDSGSLQYNGGAVMFGAAQGSWAAIKGWLNDGSNNTNGGLSIYSRTATTDSTLTERVRVNTTGLTNIFGSLGRSGFVTKTGSFTLADDENWLICNGSGTITVTFPSASLYTTREVMFKTVQNQAVISASSNVVPLAGGAATTSILSATAGKWATLVCDGTNWHIMQAN